MLFGHLPSHQFTGFEFWHKGSVGDEVGNGVGAGVGKGVGAGVGADVGSAVVGGGVGYTYERFEARWLLDIVLRNYRTKQYIAAADILT